MLFLELLVIIVIAAFVANGIRSGSIETLGRLIGSILGFLAAKKFSGWLVSLLAFFIPLNWAYLAAFVTIFLVVDYFVGFIFKIAENLFKILTRLPILKQINGLLGGLFGFVEAVVVIGGVSWLLSQGAAGQGFQLFSGLKTIAFLDVMFKFLLAFLL